jgi:hypothetical protein
MYEHKMYIVYFNLFLVIYIFMKTIIPQHIRYFILIHIVHNYIHFTY